ncbi:MAG TPA: alpha-(1-_3)-arabinofuranosyltransferase family protein [Marmoricola sp.]|nr:alpha-(1->3)-arabinofuranosyltransferase family protein [Marmoricola sp.]
MRAIVERPRTAAAAAYAVVLLAFLTEQAGRTTTDTKASLIDAPASLLHSTFSLWNPQMSLGELQNQAYGYLFPMGPFFGGLHLVGVPAWVTERLWSWVVVVAACEGARLVCRQLGLSAWPALAAGLAYGLDVRIISEIGVRSAEVLPTAALPWVLLPVLWALRGRVDVRLAALFSAAAFLFGGAVNATGTIAPLPLVVVFIVWGCWQGLARWSLLGWWSAAIVAVSLWWAASLVELSAYSPPFYDYVEDSRTTTSTTGFDASVRGASNWVGYLTTAGRPSWPAAWSLDYHPLLVAATGAVAAIGVVGLAVFRSRWRVPLILSAVIGLTCLTIGHTSTSVLQSPLASTMQSALDHPFALLRNVPKIDPVLRLPLVIGFGAALARLGGLASALSARAARRRRGAAVAGVVAAVLLVVAGAQPVLALNTRTPGWDHVPAYWSQTANYLAAQPGQNRAWVVPGSGFGIQTWGWTMDEPMSIVADSPWVTRSQVPLAGAGTIRMLTSLEDLLDSGSGSPELGEMLDRVGIGYVVLRHDLDPSLDDSSPSNVAAVALATSGGLKRVAAFGQLDFGPAVEVFEVTGRDTGSGTDLRLQPEATARTISSGPADVLTAVESGLLAPDQAAVVTGEDGWKQPTDIVGDSYQLRERQYGRVHAAEGPVLARGEPRRLHRYVENYPGAPGAQLVSADYHGVAYVNASTSQGYPDSFGPIHPESAPYAAVDGDAQTAWTTASLTRPVGQWLAVHYDAAQTFDTVTVHSDPGTGTAVRRWRISAGSHTVVARTDPATGVATADLHGARSSALKVTVAAVKGHDSRSQVSVQEISGAGLPVQRSLVVPEVPGAAPTSYLFTSTAETRACVPTLLGPDCDPARRRFAEEAVGIDREITVPASGTFSVSGAVVARADPSTAALLDPLSGSVVMHGSSTYADDPTVSPRMAYDGLPTTSWLADPGDDHPSLVVDFAKPRRLDRLTVTAPGSPGVTPTEATLVSGTQTRHVDLALGAFEPLVAKRLVITFSNPSHGTAPLGVGEVQLGPGSSAVPLDGTAATGAVCGFGPNVSVDGHRYTTRVDGRIGDISDAEPMTFSLCGAPVAISAGVHRVVIAATSQFQPVRTALTRTDATDTDPTTPARTMTVLSASATAQRVRVGAGAASLLVTGRNNNAGWQATLDGRTLHPQEIDGWAQGWRVPAGDGGLVKITFAPQRNYLIGLLGGLGLSGLVLLLAVVLLLRTRLRPALAPAPVAAAGSLPARKRARPRRRLRLGAGVIAAVAVGWVLGGLPGLLGVALVWLPGHRLRPAAAGVLVVAGALVSAWSLHLHGPGPIPDAADLLTGTGIVLALAHGLRSSRDLRA